jgi:MFS transporter, DHA3 family, macrolide efflux protein
VSARALLGDRSFRLLWSAHTISSFGDALTALALLLTAQRLTGSTSAVALTAIAIALPQLLVGLFAGVLVERWDRRRLMILADFARALLVLGFLAVTTADRLWLLLVLALAQSTIGTFFSPARSTLIAELLPADRLLPANSLCELSRVVAGVAGTGAAGLLATANPTLSAVFVVDSATFLVSAVLVALVRAPRRPRDRAPSGTLRELEAGLRVVFGSRVLVGVVAAGAVAMLGLGAVNVLLVPFVVGELAASAAWFGPLEAAQVAAMVTAGTLVAAFSSRLRPPNLVSVGAFGLGVSVMALAACAAPWQLAIVLFAAGCCVAPLQAAVTTLLQTQVSPDYRARAHAAFMTLVSGAGLVSMSLVGFAAETAGTRGVFLGAGAIVVVAGVVSAAAFHGASSVPRPAALEARRWT